MHYRFIYFCLIISIVTAASAANKQIITNNTNNPIKVSLQLPEHTQAIIELRKLPQKNLQIKLLKAIQNDSADDIKLLAKAGLDLNKEIGGQKPIVMAVIRCAEMAVRALIECNVDLDIMIIDSYCCDGKKYIKLIKFVMNRDNAKIAKLILEKTQDFSVPQDKDEYERFLYSLFGCPELLDLYLKNGLPLNDVVKVLERNPTSTFLSDVFYVLLKAGLNPNRKIFVDSEYYPMNGKNDGTIYVTLLSFAIHSSSSAELVRFMLEEGADPNMPFWTVWNGNGNKITPLEYAIGNIDVALALIEYGAHI